MSALGQGRWLLLAGCPQTTQQHLLQLARLHHHHDSSRGQNEGQQWQVAAGSEGLQGLRLGRKRLLHSLMQHQQTRLPNSTCCSWHGCTTTMTAAGVRTRGSSGKPLQAVEGCRA